MNNGYQNDQSIRALIRPVWRLFVLLLSLSLSAHAGTRTTYFVNDAYGSPVVSLDESGTVIQRSSRTPYGDSTELPFQPSNNAIDRIGFTGHIQDDTGLVYMGARYYDPIAGRFMGMDPAGFNESNPQSFNRYAYANNNPYGYVDPDGAESADVGQITETSFNDALQNKEAVAAVASIVETSIDIATAGTFALGRTILKKAAQLAQRIGPKRSAKKTVESNGEIAPYYPPNRGFLGDSEKLTLKPGTQIDRYGFDGGTFVSPRGTPPQMRALPPGSIDKPYSAFEVTKPFTVDGGRTAPAFGQIGLGTQYELPTSVRNLVRSGALKRIK